MLNYSLQTILFVLLTGLIPPALMAQEAPESQAGQESVAECVILLHGLARTSRSMEELQQKLGDAGYQVVNASYDSRHQPIETLARNVVPAATAQCAAGARINFVTHSLGGILVRFYLSESGLDHLGRVVMLGPPNQGSEAVDALANMPGFAALNGPAGLQLGTGPDSIPNRLPPANFEVGIIAGSRSINLFLSMLIPGADDGKVSIERAKLAGMTDFLVVSHTHPMMMDSDDVIEQVIFFLRHGRFDAP
jgi:hypothetical protein